MRPATIEAIVGVIKTDATVDADEIDAIRLHLEGKTVETLARREPLGRVIPHKTAAELLSVSPRTLQLYARRGILKPVCLGKAGARSIGYTEQSVRDALEGRRS